MWWPLAPRERGGPATGPPPGNRFRYEPVLEDIESLNRRTHRGDLEITALSCAQYPHVTDVYALTACGSSLGDQYGPVLVANRPLRPSDLARPEVVVAVPGERTSAFAAASVLLGPGSFRHEVVPFDQIIPAVRQGRYAAGLVIHEGQVTFAEQGLHLVADVGMSWSSRCGLPLPLGVNAIRRDLETLHGPGTLRSVASDLRRSIDFAMGHRAEALAYARRFARGATAAQSERFVDMYVNRFTLDLGSVGRAAIRTFLAETCRAGLTPDAGEVDFIGS